MHDEKRTVRYDKALDLEAFRLTGIIQCFPRHFHEHYVIGYLEHGQRFLTCGGRDYRLRPGDLTLFNPGDMHACRQIGEDPLDYRGLNIRPDQMRAIVRGITGSDALPHFSLPVVYQGELAPALRDIHERIMTFDTDFEKEEALLLLLRELLSAHAAPQEDPPAADQTLDAVCRFLEENYTRSVSLDELSALASVSKYHLLRAFTKYKGISPYQYLTALRISEAKKLLEAGVSPVETALRTGFSDQSHFTNFFKARIGLTPGQYRQIFQ